VSKTRQRDFKSLKVRRDIEKRRTRGEQGNVPKLDLEGLRRVKFRNVVALGESSRGQN